MAGPSSCRYRKIHLTDKMSVFLLALRNDWVHMRSKLFPNIAKRHALTSHDLGFTARLTVPPVGQRRHTSQLPLVTFSFSQLGTTTRTMPQGLVLVFLPATTALPRMLSLTRMISDITQILIWWREPLRIARMSDFCIKFLPSDGVI
jgi:hypothetical protein